MGSATRDGFEILSKPSTTPKTTIIVMGSGPSIFTVGSRNVTVFVTVKIKLYVVNTLSAALRGDLLIARHRSFNQAITHLYFLFACDARLFIALGWPAKEE
jgi:hypothetical protein